MQRPTPSIASSSRPKPSSSTHAPVTLTKRLLFPHLPPAAPIPHILPDAPPALNTELYDLVALALRAYVTPWWSKITRYDKSFLPEITRVVTVVIRTLDARARAADISPLVFRDLPAAIAQHYADYRSAARKGGSSYAAGGATAHAQLFHALQQHIGVTPEGALEEVYMRTAIDAVLKVCLPEEDWEADPERYIVREIVVKIICADVVPRITQPWFVYKTMLDLLGPAEDILKPPDPRPRRAVPSSSAFPSWHTIVVFFLSTIQTISSTALALIAMYKQAVHTIKTVNTPAPTPKPPSAPAPAFAAADIPSEPTSPTSPVTNTMRPPSPLLLSRSQTSSAAPRSLPSSTAESTQQPSIAAVSPLPPHDLARPLLSLFSELFTLRTRFASNALLVLLSMLTSVTSPFLNRLLPHLLYTRFLCAPFITQVLITSKRALFPNGYPAPPPPDPSPEEELALRAALARRVASILPGPLGTLILGPHPPRTLAALLDPLGSQACNAHLFIVIFDLILLALFPELAVGSGEEVATGDGTDGCGDEVGYMPY
ncbi:hypothetical protein FA95DRAFT_1605272 [Auriscalpium vulgare]|uniref:Uncharacterized protein n=1 Tax=Auriscalpium vulgare TaxID=40419 RepID=A0ACB8RWW9_9AGAM|nr:hypothetical protein FA95DRAFT_1605272 [Auriscalpium vulgare]